MTDQVIYLKEHEKQALCIPKVVIQGQSAHEIVISEAHLILAHLGAGKMLAIYGTMSSGSTWSQM